MKKYLVLAAAAVMVAALALVGCSSGGSASSESAASAMRCDFTISSISPGSFISRSSENAPLAGTSSFWI